MDDYAEVQHKEDCKWVIKEIKKTRRWFIFMNLKKCPSCDGSVDI